MTDTPDTDNPTPRRTWKDLRREYLTRPLLAWYRKRIPPMSSTEREAIEAGTVWWDAQLFSGNPDWTQLLRAPKAALSDEEQAFLSGPVEELCAMLDDWRIQHEWRDLPPEAWAFIKTNSFFGMIIPKRYGGLGFSAQAHSAVVSKISTRSIAAAVTVMVPNSLGPAELLLHYGTDAQKNHYLPRLATGIEIPCFALTGPEAGSDASAMPDVGIVCRGMFEGNEVLGLRLTWDKRYITLGPVATLLGLAFRVRDPDRLLGGVEDLGITVALLPTSTPGVHIGRRHLPVQQAFMNGPNSGKDVFIPMDWLIGGQERIGQGWRMLVECLAAGRGISLPALAAGGVKMAARTTGAYGRVRKQFGVPVGKFEGVQEALARIGGFAYLMESMRRLTAVAIDMGEKPSVLSAIAKFHGTEMMRKAINDAMDIHGGKGIIEGPRNYLANVYHAMPVSITVEGANILTRSLIIFGQGAIRCHPYVLAEMRATQDDDHARASRDFDAALFGHARFAMANKARAWVMALTGSLWVGTPSAAAPELRRYYQHLTRLSSGFAFLSDVSMLVLGGSLKRREKLSARLGDMLSHLYLASCVLKRYEEDGRRQEDLPLVEWALQDSLHHIQSAFDGVLANYPGALLGWCLRRVIFPLGMHFQPPSDQFGHTITRILIEPSAQRDRLTAGMYLPSADHEPVATLEAALLATVNAETIEAKIRAAQKSGSLDAVAGGEHALAQAALAAGVISTGEHAQLQRARTLRDEVVRVDHFPQDLGASEAVEPVTQRREAA